MLSDQSRCHFSPPCSNSDGIPGNDTSEDCRPLVVYWTGQLRDQDACRLVLSDTSTLGDWLYGGTLLSMLLWISCVVCSFCCCCCCCLCIKGQAMLTRRRAHVLTRTRTWQWICAGSNQNSRMSTDASENAKTYRNTDVVCPQVS